MNGTFGKISVILMMVSLLLCSCTTKSEPKSAMDEKMAALELPSSVEKSFRKSSELMDALALNMKSFEELRYFTGLTELKAEAFYGATSMTSLYIPENVKSIGTKAFTACNALKYIAILTPEVIEAPDAGITSKLIEETMMYPVYLPKGTKLYIDFETSGLAVVRLLNADSHATLRTWSNKKSFRDSILIANSAIYLVDVQLKDNMYINLTMERTCKDLVDVTRSYEVAEEEVPCRAGDFLSRKVDGLSISSLFEEPRKVTLRSQGKAFFSGGSRSVVAMQVPANCTDIAYCLRISTSQTDQSTDGQFCKKVDEKYKEIKFLGLPIYESHGTGSNIFRELLNATEPPREEEAYCNLYVFTNQAEAKKFSDGKPVAELKYDMDFSKQGTQSCNDRIPTKGIKTLYFGFENTRVRYSVYLWLESVSTVKTTEYFKMKYSLED